MPAKSWHFFKKFGGDFMKCLFLTEKKSVAEDYAKILHVAEEKDGKFENDQYVITWCRGHLVEMAYPEEYDEKYKKWNSEDLPFIPDEYIFNIKLMDRYKVVHEQLYRKDIGTAYFCGDAGREGEYIYRLILLKGGMRKGMNALRVWIDSTTKENVLKGIREAKPISEYDTLYAAAMERGIEDYLVGMNFSRMLTVKYGRKFNSIIKSDKWKSIDVGRVMSCVLGMVVRREREINNFKETVFYKINAEIVGLTTEWKSDEKSAYSDFQGLYKDVGFLNKTDAEDFCKNIKDEHAFLEELETYMSNKKAPLLYNLAELQNECSEKLKISPDETLSIVQTLYENALTTYPRTDARVLSSAIAKVIDENIKGLLQYTPVQDFVQEIINSQSYQSIGNSQYTDDKKITDHYAIIPTGNLDKLGQLNELQKKVYDMIVRRFLSIFFPPAVYNHVKAAFRIGQEGFHTSGKVLINPGYMKVIGKEVEEETGNDSLFKLAQKLKKGMDCGISSLAIKEGKTTPPKRYTSGSMILAMENAGQLIEDDELRAQIKGSGIGTSATRSEIIKKLISKGYIEHNKKTQIIRPHPDGIAVYDIINEVIPDFLSPDITAEWERKLDKIRSGILSQEEHRTEVECYIKQTVEKIKDLNSGKNYEGTYETKEICKCPSCHTGKIVTKKFGYACTAYQKDGSGCNFAIGKISERKLTEAEVQNLINKGNTGLLKHFKSKKGTEFEAELILVEEEGRKVIKFSFPERKIEYLEGTKCPLCGKKIAKKAFGYGCSGYNKDDKNSCKFTVNEKIASKKIPEKQIIKLLSEGKTEKITGFKSKAGKNFSAMLVLENGTIKFCFDK